MRQMAVEPHYIIENKVVEPAYIPPIWANGLPYNAIQYDIYNLMTYKNRVAVVKGITGMGKTYGLMVMVQLWNLKAILTMASNEQLEQKYKEYKGKKKLLLSVSYLLQKEGITAVVDTNTKLPFDSTRINKAQTIKVIQTVKKLSKEEATDFYEKIQQMSPAEENVNYKKTKLLVKTKAIAENTSYEKAWYRHHREMKVSMITWMKASSIIKRKMLKDSNLSFEQAEWQCFKQLVGSMLPEAGEALFITTDRLIAMGNGDVLPYRKDTESPDGIWSDNYLVVIDDVEGRTILNAAPITDAELKFVQAHNSECSKDADRYETKEHREQMYLKRPDHLKISTVLDRLNVVVVYTTAEGGMVEALTRQYGSRIAVLDQQNYSEPPNDTSNLIMVGTSFLTADTKFMMKPLFHQLEKVMKTEFKLFANGLEIGHSLPSIKGDNGFNKVDTVVILANPHPVEIDTFVMDVVFTTGLAEKDVNTNRIKKVFLLDRFHQSIGRNTGLRDNGFCCLVICHTSMFEDLLMSSTVTPTIVKQNLARDTKFPMDTPLAGTAVKLLQEAIWQPKKWLVDFVGTEHFKTENPEADYEADLTTHTASLIDNHKFIKELVEQYHMISGRELKLILRLKENSDYLSDAGKALVREKIQIRQLEIAALEYLTGSDSEVSDRDLDRQFNLNRAIPNLAERTKFIANLRRFEK